MAQYNLVPNPSFEIYTSCPTLGGEIWKAPPWFNPHNTPICGAGTPDYLHSCDPNPGSLGVPSNGFGNEPARTGIAYAGLYTMNLPYTSVREYIEVELLDSLKQDEQYVVSFYVSLAEQVKFATHKIGVYFSDTVVVNSCDTLLPFSPQIVNTSANPLTNKNGWTLVTDTLTAMGGEKYMIIGNFFPLSQSDTVYVGGTGWGGCCSYY